MRTPENLRELVPYLARNFQNKIGLQIKEETGYRSYSYQQIEEWIVKISAALRQLGFQKGDRAAVMAENRPEWGLSYLAIIYAGGIAVPLDPLLKEEEISVLLKDSQSSFLFLSQKFAETGVSLIKNLPFLKGLINFDQLSHQNNYYSFSQLKNEARGEILSEALAPDETASLVYTSGTTGTPKGVELTHRNLIFEITTLPKIIDINESDRTVSVLPLHHTFESTTDFLTVLYVGATVTYITGLKSSKIFEAIQENKATIFVAVPLLYQLIFQGIFHEISESSLLIKIMFKFFWTITSFLPFKFLKKIFFKKLHQKFGGNIRFFVSGGAAIDKKLLEGFKRLGFEILQGYGLTEAAPVVSANSLDKNRLGSVGHPLPGIEIKIVPQKNEPRVGELFVKGPNVMKGYYQRDDLTSQVIQDSWLATGDLAFVDQDGFIYITGRLKDVIVAPSGQNIYPDEIEGSFIGNSAIKEICVFGAESKESFKKGTEVVAAVILPDEKFLGNPAYIEKIIAEYNQNCTSYKRIENFKIVFEELPKTSTRKIKRNLVKKMWDQLK